MVRIAALALCLVGAAAQQSGDNTTISRMGSIDCSTKYMTAYMAMVSGSCVTSEAQTCPTQCQQIIDDVKTACNTSSYNTTQKGTGDIKEKSFLSKAMDSLQLMGPVDCKYDFEATARHACNPHCTRAEVTGQNPQGYFGMHGCLKVSNTVGPNEELQATWEKCDGSCRAKFQTLTNECAACYAQPVITDFLSKASTQLLKCTVGTEGEGSCDAGLWDGLDRVCCDGSGGAGDCNLTAPLADRIYPSCGSGDTVSPYAAACAAAVRSAGHMCPDSFLLGPASSKMLGMFEQCGGSLQQLYAARPSLRPQLLYCDNPDIRKGIAMPAESGSGRRLEADEAAHAMPPEINAGVTMDDLTGEEPFEERVAAVKRSMNGLLSQLGGQRRLQQSSDCASHPLDPSCHDYCTNNPQAPGCPSNLTCSTKYQQAFVSTIQGDCGLGTCTVGCQSKITEMLKACAGVTYRDAPPPPTPGSPPPPASVVTAERSFSQKAVVSLQYLGPSDCSYSLQVSNCNTSTTGPDHTSVCSIGAAVTALSTTNNCATFFMGVDYHTWNPEACANPACTQELFNYVQQCQGCTDPFMKTLLSKAAAGEATTCGAQDCENLPTISANIRQICCAGPDGIVGNADDPCSSAKTVSGTPFYLPTTCTADSPCQSYITSLASQCTSAFLTSELAGLYADCGGDVQQLVTGSKNCTVKASDLLQFTQHGNLDKCMGSCDDANSDGNCTGNEIITMKSGEGCNIQCHTQFCLGPAQYTAGSDAAAQPQCIDGCIVNANGQQFGAPINAPGACTGLLASAPPAPNLQCLPVAVSTCDYPANGGCDPASLCDDKTDLFGTKLVQCGPCPAGYTGSGRPTQCDASGIYDHEHCAQGGCVDINECEQNACDPLTTCTNFPGGYRCGPCPDADGYTGTGETGCMLPGQELKARNASLTAAIAARKKDLDNLFRVCYQQAAHMSTEQLHNFEKTQFGPCNNPTCSLKGCSVTLTDDCFYIFPVPRHCTAQTTNTTTFYSKQSIRAAIEGARVYISSNQKVTGQASAWSLFSDGGSIQNGINWETTLFLVLVVAVFVGGFCFLCTKKRVGDGAGNFEKINVGDIGTGPSIYDSTWAR